MIIGASSVKNVSYIIFKNLRFEEFPRPRYVMLVDLNCKTLFQERKIQKIKDSIFRNLTVSYYIQPNLKINDFGGPLPERKKSETKQEWRPLLANSRKNIGKYFFIFLWSLYSSIHKISSIRTLTWFRSNPEP